MLIKKIIKSIREAKWRKSIRKWGRARLSSFERNTGAAFEIVYPELGIHYKIYENGSISGFNGSPIVINRIPLLRFRKEAS